MPPFLGQGANQALQDAWVLAEQLARARDDSAEEKTAALRRYEAIRKPPTTAIMLSSRVIGFVETGSGLVAVARDAAFGVLGKLGIAGKIFLKNAVPTLE
jgi:2-polyprenyl-6-methoxyphenol hydroxylase-like FAD-dependent oxidoreductase